MKLKRFLLSAAFVALATQAFAQAGGPYSAPSVRTYMGPSLGELYQPSDGIKAGVNAQTGTTYTVLNSDQGKLTTFSNTGAVAVTLPQAGTAGFEANKVFYFTNKNTGTVTITPTTSTIGGAATLVLNQNRSAQVVSDGTNYLLQTSSSSATVSSVSEGGTGAATFTAHGPLVGEGTSPFVASTPGTTGQVYAGVTGADPAFTATPSGLTSLGATTLTGTTVNGTAVNTGADAAAGTLSIFPATTATGKTTLTATSNSGATTTNINTAAQAGARTYTVPDAGGNANFLLTGATQSATTGLTPTRLKMLEFRTASGVAMAAAASGTNFGITYTPGTTALLIGTATSSSSTSDVATVDVVLPSNYIAGTDITLSAGCYYTNSSSTASVHTMTAAAYLNTAAGLQGTTLIATGAQTCPITTSALQTFTITGATLVPGSYLSLAFTANVTNGAGASTEFLTSASLN